MPRYFFDMTDQGVGPIDNEGVVLADAKVARREAIGTLALMAKDELPDGNSHDFTAIVRDETGKVIFKASLVLSAEWVD